MNRKVFVMFYRNLLIIVFGSLFAASAIAQIDGAQQKVCFQPYSYKVGELNFENPNDLVRPMLEFEQKVKDEGNQAKGHVFVYAGKKTQVNATQDAITKIKATLNIGKESWKSRVWVYDSGYRRLPTVELFIQPLECSQYPEGTSDFDVEQIEFDEAPKAESVWKSDAELLNSLATSTETKCPPAARAVRACDNTVQVFLIINESGSVVFARGISGHPLLRISAADQVKTWKFKPTRANGKPVKVVGRIPVQFKNPESNETY